MSKRYKMSKLDIAIIQQFAETIDNEIEIYKGCRYEVDTDLKEVYLGTKRYDRVSKIFTDWLYSKIDFEPNWCVVSILHEIGHIKTMTESLDKDRKLKDGIYGFLYQEGVISEIEYFNNYFEIDAEYQATMWGVEYYKNHLQECEKLAEMLGV